MNVHRWYMIPYFWVGSKAYDLVAGSAGLQGSYFLSRSKALKIFPMLKSDGLAGAMVYYECNCGAILDPKTKSFAHLNNAAMNAGWKVRWNSNGTGYQPFCVKCGEGVE